MIVLGQPPLLLPPKPAIVRPSPAMFMPGFVGKPRIQQKIDTTGKTRIGNMTNAGGLNAAFDGDLVEVYTSGMCADQSGSGDATVGIDWGSGVTHNLTGFKAYFNGSGGVGPYNSGSINAVVYLRGSNDNFVSDVNVLYTSSPIAGNYGTTLSVLTGITPGNYRYHHIRIVAQSSAPNTYVSEVEFYETI